MNYRSAISDDAAKIAALSIEVWLHTYAKDGVSSAFADYVLQRFTPTHFQQYIADNEKQIIICENADHLLGYIALDYNPVLPESLGSLASTAEIATLYVRDHHNGRGVGSALMHQARTVAATRKRSHIWLAVLHDNQRALNFYRQQGLQRQGSLWFELPEERHENYVLIQPV